MIDRRKVPVTAVVITKNEENALSTCLQSLEFLDQVVVVDSASTDRTAEIARAHGAELIEFEWNGRYPKKKQWGMDHPSIRNSWVLHLDGDEAVSPRLATEITRSVRRTRYSAYDIPLAYHFMGRELKHGHRVRKRSLVKRERVRFPEVDDLGAPGITEVEGHYQPVVHGRVGSLRAKLIHDDPDPLSDWIARHNRYSDWEAYLRNHRSVASNVSSSRSSQGRIFDRVPGKPVAFFAYSYFCRLGFLDGAAGFHYACSLSIYYYQISLKVLDSKRTNGQRT